MRIYVACLAAYNNAKHHGVWIDMDGATYDEVWAQIGDMLAESPEPDAEEWAVHDYDDLPTTLGEWPDLRELCEALEVADDLGIDPALFVEIMTDIGTDPGGMKDAMIYWGDSEADLAQEYMDGIMEVPDHLQFYIDWQKVHDDLRMDAAAYGWHDGNYYMVFGL